MKSPLNLVFLPDECLMVWKRRGMDKDVTCSSKQVIIGLVASYEGD
jgi:hypothetical protein